MAKKPAAASTDTGSSSSGELQSFSGQASPTASSHAEGAGATITDEVEANVQSVGGPASATTGSVGDAGGPSASISHITQPEQAVNALKAKVSEVHKLINDVGHYAAMPIVEIEALMADIGFLMNFVRSKI